MPRSRSSRSRRAAAIQGGIRYFFRPAFGLEFRAAYASGELDGVNTPYRVELSYIARLPPDFIPRPEHYENATPWPDTSGYLHRVMLAGNLVGRVSRGRVTAAMTGGFAWQRISGDAEPLGYTLFRLGGRSVLFVFDHQVSVRLQPASGPGFDVGGEVGFDLGRRVAFVSGLQVFGGPALMPDVQVDALRSSDPFPAATIDEIRAVLRPGPARVPFTTTVLMFGITVH